MRVIVLKTPEGATVEVVPMSDISAYKKQVRAIIDEYMQHTEALAAAHEALRKDPQNLTTLFRLSACVNILCNITLAVREMQNEHT